MILCCLSDKNTGMGMFRQLVDICLQNCFLSASQAKKGFAMKVYGKPIVYCSSVCCLLN